MVDNAGININVQIGNNTELDNSPIANVNINYTAKSLIQILNEAYTEVVCEINEIQAQSTKRELLRLIDGIKEYFINNTKVLEKILEQVNCKIQKSQEKNILTLVKLLSFLAVASHTNNSITIPNIVNSGIKIKEKNSWLFNAANLSDISLPKHISKIAEYISRTPDCNIKNGNCYIAMLLSYKDINLCNNCEKGLLKDTYIKILPNIIDSNIDWQNDFFDLRLNKNLVFKCGKCTSNISQYEFAKEILEDI